MHHSNRRFCQTFLILLLFIQFAAPTLAQENRNRQLTQEEAARTGDKRIALIIGNAAYTSAKPLQNPANDANDMAATLKSLGFEVLSGTNQNKREIETLIRQFGNRLAETKGTGLFYYAGHGLQVGGENYIVPVDAEIPEADEVQYQAVPMNLVLSKMNSAGNDLNIVILDACRNNPFARGWRGFRDGGEADGLARITPPQGTIVLYATQPGNVASDGTGRNGLFTESLLQQIKKPNVELDQLVKALTRDVSEKSQRKQFPWREGSSIGDFYFAGTNKATAADSTKADSTKIELSEKPFSAEQIIEKFFQTVGGKANAQKLRSIVRTGSLEGTFNGIKFTGTVVEIWKAPNKLYSELKSSDGTTVSQEGFDGKNGWSKESSGVVTQMTGQSLAVKKLGAELYAIADINLFKNLFPEFKLKGSDVVEGKENFVVEAAPAVGKPFLFYFDKQTGLLSRSDYYIEDPLRKEVVLTQSFVSEYVEVNNLMIPFVYNQSVADVSFTTRYNPLSVKFNVPIAETKFQVP